GLHVVIRKALLIGLFKGALIGQRGIMMSQLMYDDDVILLGDCNLWRVGVDHEESSKLASVLGCGVLVLPFTYLGVHVGCNMSRLANWKDVVDKFKHKLSTWNSHTLSVGGRLALIKVVLGNLPTYYMSLYKVPSAIERNLESMRNNFFIGGDLEDRKMTWVAWKKCLASKEHGGLGVGSIFALNRALMFKWIWRFMVTFEDLWIKVIKNIYGNSGRIGEASFPSSASSPWIAILKATKHLTEKGIDLLSLCKRKVGDGSSISFWDDDWCGDRPLKLQFPRVYALDDAKSCTVVERLRLLDWFSVFRRPPRGGD
ncbi:hypothetical protein Tco_0927991, partial [Tanacetum coccineum]